MGCVCCSVGSFVSTLLDAVERVSLCTVCAALTCCLMLTIITVLVMGIGIGYNYCSVTRQVEAMANAAKGAGAPETRRSGEQKHSLMRSVDKAVKQGLSHRLSRREADTPGLNSSLIHSLPNIPIIKNHSFAA